MEQTNQTAAEPQKDNLSLYNKLREVPQDAKKKSRTDGSGERPTSTPCEKSRSSRKTSAPAGSETGRSK